MQKWTVNFAEETTQCRSNRAIHRAPCNSFSANA